MWVIGEDQEVDEHLLAQCLRKRRVRRRADQVIAIEVREVGKGGCRVHKGDAYHYAAKANATARSLVLVRLAKNMALPASR